MHKKGIGIHPTGELKERLGIHPSQLIDIEFFKANDASIIEKKKSVVGRAAVGALLLGPHGAVIGGLSGVGSKSVKREPTVLMITFWDVITKEPTAILIRTEENPSRFVARCKKDLNIQWEMGANT